MIMNSTQILEMNINRDSQPPGGRLLAFGPLLPSHDMHLKKKEKRQSGHLKWRILHLLEPKDY